MKSSQLITSVTNTMWRWVDKFGDELYQALATQHPYYSSFRIEVDKIRNNIYISSDLIAPYGTYHRWYLVFLNEPSNVNNLVFIGSSDKLMPYSSLNTFDDINHTTEFFLHSSIKDTVCVLPFNDFQLATNISNTLDEFNALASQLDKGDKFAAELQQENRIPLKQALLQEVLNQKDVRVMLNRWVDKFGDELIRIVDEEVPDKSDDPDAFDEFVSGANHGKIINFDIINFTYSITVLRPKFDVKAQPGDYYIIVADTDASKVEYYRSYTSGISQASWCYPGYIRGVHTINELIDRYGISWEQFKQAMNIAGNIHEFETLFSHMIENT